MIKYKLYQNHLKDSPTIGKWYAKPIPRDTINLDQLAEHMANHNAGFSEATCVAVMRSMVKCIKEELLDGKNVKIDNLAIFSVGIKNKKGGADTEEDFSVVKNVDSVKLRSRATGTLSNKNLDMMATLRKWTLSGGTTENTGSATTPPTTEPTNPNPDGDL